MPVSFSPLFSFNLLHHDINMYFLHTAPIHFLPFWQGEFVWQSQVSSAGIHFATTLISDWAIMLRGAIKSLSLSGLKG